MVRTRSSSARRRVHRVLPGPTATGYRAANAQRHGQLRPFLLLATHVHNGEEVVDHHLAFVAAMHRFLWIKTETYFRQQINPIVVKILQ